MGRDNGHEERRSPSAGQDIPTKSHPGLIHLYPSVNFGKLVPWIFLGLTCFIYTMEQISSHTLTSLL